MKDNARLRRIGIFVAQVAVVLLGELFNAATFNALIVPARLLSGGVVGASLLLHQLLNLPIGLQTLIYNIPIFLLGYRYLGRRFVVLSIIGVASFSLLLDNLVLPRLTQDLLLIAVFGGVVTGIADGIILRAGGSTGGFDIIGLIVARRFGVSVGQVFLIFNGFIIALAALFNNLELAMYTMIMLYVSSRVINGIQESTPRRLVLIISVENQRIAERILKDMQRGVTYLQGTGAYTDQDYRVLMCVVTRYELVELRALVTEIDSDAFSVVVDAADVVGRFDLISPLQRLFG